MAHRRAIRLNRLIDRVLLFAAAERIGRGGGDMRWTAVPKRVDHGDGDGDGDGDAEERHRPKWFSTGPALPREWSPAGGALNVV